ncbi:LOW QUALITY PROTEIN: hypothetical protein HID58_090477 [Brassica napus]|uniref:Uncharacterized protein n=1 Tax=Brassica napus TaxID=3708 RepID=A0ABQ7X116_BRANA|nr:LOW QUALITY PROTEIN: hypothetical protein HID58_090477 [Brassica napus]
MKKITQRTREATTVCVAATEDESNQIERAKRETSVVHAVDGGVDFVELAEEVVRDRRDIEIGVEEKMVVATMAITRSRFKLSGLEQRRFGEFSEVTEESEFQNPAPVVMDMKMVDTKVVARDEEMVVDTVDVEDGIGDTEVEMVVDTGVENMVVMDTEAMNAKVDTEVETVVTIDTVNEVVWLWI